MTFIDRILGKLNRQIKNSNVKLLKKVVDSPKIQDNNQAINNGIINEKITFDVRSKG
jgi:hypothetical protein